MTVGFGAMTIPMARGPEDSVRALELVLVGLAADTAGVLLALLWTAGFLPTFLEPQSATVLLAKPCPRWAILVGKYLGVVGFVTLHAALFVGATWLALGVSTGVWYGAYWLAVPLLAVNFAVFYAVSAFLAVCTPQHRGQRVRHAALLAAGVGDELHPAPPGRVPARGAERNGPVPDRSRLLGGAEAARFGRAVLRRDARRAVRRPGRGVAPPRRAQGKYDPAASVAASAAFAAVTLGLAAYEFEMTDY